jgi:PAS domain S-box-containing protein
MDQKTRSEQVGERLVAEHGIDDPFAAAIKATRMPIVVCDATQDDLPIVFANDSFLRQTGYERHEVIGHNCRFLQGPDTDPETVARLRDAISAGEDLTVDLLNYRKDGSRFWNALYISPVRNAAGEVVYYFGSQIDITERKEVEERVREGRADLEKAVEARTADLQAALDAKTVLLHEVDHRVKNNLQLISSLVLLQLRRSPDPTVQTALRDVLTRITAISTVHRRLFRSDDVQRFDVSEFVRDLVDDMGASTPEGVTIECDLEPVAVPSGQAAPLALIVNELLSNALRHAFPGGRVGRIHVSVRRDGGDYHVEVSDDGVGADWSRAGPQSSGRYIIELLAKQLRARLVFEDAEPGTRATVCLPVHIGTAR